MIGPDIIKNSSESLALIGYIASLCAMLEKRLVYFYATLLGGRHFQKRGVDEYGNPIFPPLDPVGLQIFSQITQTDMKMKLINELAKWYLKGDDLVEWNKLSKRIKSVIDSRNTVLHAEWGVCEDYPNELILSKIYGDQLRYTHDDFKEIAEDLISVQRDLGAFSYNLYAPEGKKI